MRMILAVASTSGSPPRRSFPFLVATCFRKSSASYQRSTPYIFFRTSLLLTFQRMCGMQQVGWSIFYALTHPLSTDSTSSLPSETWTVPGQSMRYILLVRVTYCQTLVSPGTGAALHTLFSLRELMTLDLPTLGYPTKPMLMFFLSRWKMSNCLNRLISDPLPKGLDMLERQAIVGKDLLRYFTHFAMTHNGTRSALLMSSTMCLCGKFFLSCSSRARERVPMGSRASRTWTRTSELSTTLWSSSQMRLLWPADMRLSLFSGRYQSSLFLRLSVSSSMSYSFFYAYSISSYMLPIDSFTRFRRLLGPKVVSQVQTYRSRNLFSLTGYSRREVGIFLAFTKILVGSSSFRAISMRNFSNDFWSIVLTFPNHLRLGSILAASVGLQCIFLMLGAFWSYIFNLLMVFLERNVLPTPDELPLMILSGLVEAFDFDPFWNLPWRLLDFPRMPFSYLAIVEILQRGRWKEYLLYVEQSGQMHVFAQIYCPLVYV